MEHQYRVCIWQGQNDVISRKIRNIIGPVSRTDKGFIRTCKVMEISYLSHSYAYCIVKNIIVVCVVAVFIVKCDHENFMPGLIT